MDLDVLKEHLLIIRRGTERIEKKLQLLGVKQINADILYISHCNVTKMGQ